jgi:hypothetical protein
MDNRIVEEKKNKNNRVTGLVTFIIILICAMLLIAEVFTNLSELFN